MQLRHIAVPAYSVAFLLVFLPLLDTTLSVFPPRFGEVAWRFGAAGLFSRALLTPLLGLLLAFAVGLMLEHRRVLRALSLFSAFVAVVIVGAIGLFLLDAAQMRSQVVEQAKTPFDVASLIAIGKYGLGLLVLAAFTVCGRKASRGDNAVAKSRAREKGEAAGLLLGHQRV